MTFLTHDTNFLRRELFLTPKTKRLNTLRALRSLWKRLVLHKKPPRFVSGKGFLQEVPPQISSGGTRSRPAPGEWFKSKLSPF